MTEPVEGRATIASLRSAIRLVYSSGSGALLLIVATTIVTSIAIAGQLLVGRQLLDLIADREGVDAADLMPYLVLLGGLLLASSLSQALGAELRMPLAEQVERRAMNEILDVATEVDLETYDGTEFHDRLQRAKFGSGGQSTAVVFGVVTIVSTLVVAVGVVAVLFSVVPVLVPISIVGYVPIALVSMRNNRARYLMERELTELQRERGYLEHIMSDRAHAKELRAYGVAPTLRAWRDQLWDLRLMKLRVLVRRRLARTAIGSFVSTMVLLLTLAIALVLAARGSISIGDAAVAIVGLQQLSGRLQAAGGAFGSVHQGITFLTDYDRFREVLPVLRANRPTGLPPSPPTTLTVDTVGYRYPNAADDALNTVSFQLRRGQIMAVVGANGSGKSTLAKLLCGLLTPSRGAIRWDGVDLATCDPAPVRAQIAPVFQDFAQYQVTMRRVIGLGDPARLDDEAGIRAAAEQARLAELIESLPNGLDTRLGIVFSGGTDLSVGQWQRAAIARGVFRDAPMVVLDEPSASLDPQAEADLFDLLHTLCHDRIVVFVSHRFATVRSADVVLVMHQGDVAQMGSHDELMAAGGLYRDLFLLQADRYGLAR